MRCLRVTGFAILLAYNGLAQDTITLRFNHSPQHIGRYSRGSGGDLYLLRSDSIFDYEGAYQVILPEGIALRKAAFGFEHFTGLDSGAIERTAIVVLADYQAEKKTLYVDCNGNLDLTDDGDPLAFGMGDTALVTFRNSRNDEGIFQLRYADAPYRSPELIERALARLEGHPLAEQNGIASPAHWLYTQRLNGRVTSATIGEDSILIGLMDWNCNGLYNDLGEDRVLVGNYRTGEISDRLSEGAYTVIPKMIIDLNGNYFEVIDIEETGKHISLAKTYLRPVRLQPGDVLPDFRIVSLAGDSTSLHAHMTGNDYYLLDVWGTWCVGCRVQLPRLKEMDEQYPQLTVIGLNFGDEQERARAYISENAISWFNAQCDESIMEAILLDKFPYYVLLDAQRRIVKMNAELAEVGELVK